MSNHWEITGNTLCIADVHQNTAWAKAILEAERGFYDHVVFMGDIFDSYFEPPVVSSVQETAIFAQELTDQKYGPTTVLWGNHDIPYYEARRACLKHQNPQWLRTRCSGYSNSKAKTINKNTEDSHWERREWFKLVNGWLVSHAGFHELYWNKAENEDINLLRWYWEGKEAAMSINFKSHPFFNVGTMRGGEGPWPGPLWQDVSEFYDKLPLKQVVGHSKMEKCGAGRIGRSFFIDGAQTTYAIIQTDGTLLLRSMVFKDEKWQISYDVPVENLGE